ncbi:MAG TPA: MerR family transcriptional regulator [Acidimicrobiales bacterium]|nr:MerR family transcriptional regulator [Acidimicrobiales bacterium]
MPKDESEGSAHGFRGPQVCSIVGITYRQLDYWARTGLLHPSISQARGSGSQRVYSYSDLLQLKVIKRLLDSGVSLQAARRAIECLRSSGEDLASANLVINDQKSVLAQTDEVLIDLLKGGQTVLNMVLPLGGLVSELEAAITGLGLPAAGSGTQAPLPLADGDSGPVAEAN